MAKYMSIRSAELMFPCYTDFPNIPSTSSLEYMEQNYKWDIKRVLQIGLHYYLLENHPNADEYFKKE